MARHKKIGPVFCQFPLAQVSDIHTGYRQDTDNRFAGLANQEQTPARGTSMFRRQALGAV